MNSLLHKYSDSGTVWRVAFWSCLLLGVVLTATQARPGMRARLAVITVDVRDPKGHIRVGERIEVVLRIKDYTDATEIDGFNLKVAYDPRLFAYVDGSINLGDDAGHDQQWLTKANQQADMSRITPFVDASLPGVLTVSVVDLLLEPMPTGTVARSGFLFSFELEGIAEGTGEIRPGPFPDGSVLFDPGLSPAGMPAFSGEMKVKVKNGK